MRVFLKIWKHTWAVCALSRPSSHVLVVGVGLRVGGPQDCPTQPLPQEWRTGVGPQGPSEAIKVLTPHPAPAQSFSGRPQIHGSRNMNSCVPLNSKVLKTRAWSPSLTDTLQAAERAWRAGETRGGRGHGPRPHWLAILETALGLQVAQVDGCWVLLELSPTCPNMFVLPSPVSHTEIRGKMAWKKV